MSNEFAALPVPAGDGVGVWVDTSTFGPVRTITVDGGAFSGTLFIEGSNDGAATATPLDVNPIVGVPTTIEINEMLQFLRVRRTGSTGGPLGTPNVNVGGVLSDTNLYGSLGVPAGDGSGAPFDLSSGGPVNTFAVTGAFTGQLFIDLSNDGTNFTASLLFVAGAIPQTFRGVVKAARVRRLFTTGGALPSVSVGSGGSSSSTPAPGPSPTPTPLQLVTDFYIDPINGNDGSEGLTPATPIKTMARWRQMVWGARYGAPGFPTVVVIHALNGSTNLDDGQVYGVYTYGTTANIVIQLLPTVVPGSAGVLTAGTVGYVGNNRGLVVDALLASFPISSVGTGSRWIRKVGGGKLALLIKDQGANTAMIGVPSDTSNTSTGTPTSGIVPFVAGDNYELLTQAQWPQLFSGEGCRVQLMNADVFGNTFQISYALRDRYVNCYFLFGYSPPAGQTTWYNCGFSDFVVNNGEGNSVPINSSFMGTPVQIGETPNWNGQFNVFLNSLLSCFHSGSLGGSGTLAHFDNTSTCIEAIRNSRIDLSGGAVVGSGNTGKLVNVSSGSFVTDAGNITATTSDPLPYQVAGISYAAPTVDNGKGCGVYA